MSEQFKDEPNPESAQQFSGTGPDSREASRTQREGDAWLQSPDLGALFAAIVKAKARKLSRCGGFRQDDYEDLLQDFRLKLLQAQRRFDSSKCSPLPFVLLVLDRFAASKVRDRRTTKYRCGATAVRASSSTTDESPNDTSVPVRDEEARRHRGCTRRPIQESAELAIDVETFLKGLTPELKSFAESLMANSIAEVTRKLGLSKYCARNSISELRKRCEAADLRKYLSKKCGQPKREPGT
jgi:DNA-directed RNA polymerase specialized sigma24 family protein